MTKIFSFLFAVYIAVLLMIPCSDGVQAGDVCAVQDTEVTHEHADDHTATDDLCTPFCVCACCGAVSGVVLQWNAFHFGKMIPSDLPKPTIYYKSLFIPWDIGEIWQPPKINA